MTVTEWDTALAGLTGPSRPGDHAAGAKPVVWKFGGTSVGDAGRLRAVAARLVAARRQGSQVVAVLSAMGATTDELARQAYGLSAEPPPRELDALLSAGEMMSCALAAMAVHDLGEHAVSLTGAQAGISTDGAYGNARLQRICPQRITSALDQGTIVLVAGFQGLSAGGDVTTLGRGGSDATAIALAAALGAGECDIFTDVPGVYTADPRVVTNARKLTTISHQEMLQLAGAGAHVLQTRAVELAAARNIDIHVRSSFTPEPGTWIRRQTTAPENERICGIAHTSHDPLYTITCPSPATITAAITAAMAQRGLPAGLITHDGHNVRFTAPGTSPAQVTAAMTAAGLDISVRGDLGSVSVVTATAVSQPGITTTILSALETSSIHPHLITRTPNRITSHIPAADAGRAAQILHDAFQLHASQENSSREGDLERVGS
jgi:aspartate kinase